MDTIHATWKNGQIILDGPVDWPDGLRLRVDPDRSQSEPPGPGDDEPMTPDEIARTLAAMDRIEPFDLTPDEAADLQAWEQTVKEYTIANMDKR